MRHDTKSKSKSFEVDGLDMSVITRQQTYCSNKCQYTDVNGVTLLTSLICLIRSTGRSLPEMGAYLAISLQSQDKNKKKFKK